MNRATEGIDVSRPPGNSETISEVEKNVKKVADHVIENLRELLQCKPFGWIIRPVVLDKLNGFKQYLSEYSLGDEHIGEIAEEVWGRIDEVFNSRKQ
jgi:hypothetical protein